MTQNSDKRIVIESCRGHSFCEGPKGEDPSNIDAIDLKSLISSVSPRKKVDLRTQICWTENTTAQDFDPDYLKKLAAHMDDARTIKKGVPPVTEEGLRDWCQQSINRFFKVIPESRPFMMPEPVFKFLKESQEIEYYKKTGKPFSQSAAPPKKLSEAERDRILSIGKVKFKNLEARTSEGGIPFMNPKEREAEKRLLRRTQDKTPQREVPRYMMPTRTSSRSLSRRASQRKTVSMGYTPPRPTMKAPSKPCIAEYRKAEVVYSILTGQTTLASIKEQTLKEEVIQELTEPSIQDDEPETSYEKVKLHVEEVVLKDRVNQVQKALWFSRGVNFARNFRWRLASDAYKQALSMDPNFTQAKFNLACALEQLGCYRLTKRYFLKTFVEQERSLKSLFGVALSCYKLGEYGESCYYAARGLEIEPSNWQFVYLKFLGHAALRQQEQAAVYYGDFLKYCTDIDNGFPSPEAEVLNTTDIKRWLLTNKFPMFSRFNEHQIVKAK
mmetsp:Transcript_29278/g.52391  ORF Transcript_29278/g.52391 Transcript_29278/m.52391 type:complete len:498 (-) Transcript_29278:859-2352(-)